MYSKVSYFQPLSNQGSIIDRTYLHCPKVCVRGNIHKQIHQETKCSLHFLPLVNIYMSSCQCKHSGQPPEDNGHQMCQYTRQHPAGIFSILSSLARLDRNCVLHVWRETVKIASSSTGALVPAVSPYWGKTHTSQHSIIITASGPQAQLQTKPDPRLASWEWCAGQLPCLPCVGGNVKLFTALSRLST